MGTNYYLCAPHLDEVKDEEDDLGLHIGKSSAGWTFTWRAHDDLDIRTRDDWEDFVNTQGDCIIKDEYGRPLTFAEFREVAYIENRDPTGEIRLRPGHQASGPPYRKTIDSNEERFHHYWFC